MFHYLDSTYSKTSWNQFPEGFLAFVFVGRFFKKKKKKDQFSKMINLTDCYQPGKQKSEKQSAT